MQRTIEIRQATADDFDALADILFDAVRHCRSKYTEQQRQAWAPQHRSGAEWIERLSSQVIFVAADATQLLGFMSLADNGYIDFAFIRPSEQGTGIFRRLYESTEKLARQQGERRLWVHASLMARPAFGAMGFEIVRKETVKISDQSFERFEMEKQFVSAWPREIAWLPY